MDMLPPPDPSLIIMKDYRVQDNESDAKGAKKEFGFFDSICDFFSSIIDSITGRKEKEEAQKKEEQKKQEEEDKKKKDE